MWNFTETFSKVLNMDGKVTDYKHTKVIHKRVDLEVDYNVNLS